MKYSKPPLTFEKQCEKLVGRGLVVGDPQRAAEILRQINYYRLSAYFRPFWQAENCFISGTTLEQISYLYEFDSKLRLIFMDAIESIEVALRTHIAYLIAHKYGAFGYVNKNNFEPAFSHDRWMQKLEKNVRKSQERFVKHYFSNYTSEKYLPVWMVVEIVTIGQLSTFFTGLQKAERQTLAHSEYKTSAQVLGSWLHTTTYIRNICAHHSRLWNRSLAIAPKLTKAMYISQPPKIFAVVQIFKHLIPDAVRWSIFVANLETLLRSYPNVPLRDMGFPTNWREILIRS